MYGTAYYIAPEVLSGNYTEKCDLWSIGVILYIMLSGKPPFAGKNDDEILAKVQQGYYQFPSKEWSKRSEECKNLISKLMERDTNKRLTATEALDHPWIHRKVKTDFDTDLAMQAISNLKTFNAEAKLKQATLTFMVT